METTPPQEPRPAPLESAPPAGTSPPPDKTGASSKATNSLVLAILAPVSMFLTGPASMFAMLLTYPSQGPSPRPWVAPLVLFSLPLLFASLGLRQALPALKQLPRGSGSWSAAAAALCISGLVFVLALGPLLDLLGVF